MYRMEPLQYRLGSQSLMPNLCLLTFGYLFIVIFFKNPENPDVNILKEDYDTNFPILSHQQKN